MGTTCDFDAALHKQGSDEVFLELALGRVGALALRNDDRQTLGHGGSFGVTTFGKRLQYCRSAEWMQFAAACCSNIQPLLTVEWVARPALTRFWRMPSNAQGVEGHWFAAIIATAWKHFAENRACEIELSARISEERMKQLFARKPLQVLLAEMAGEHRLRRVLGPVSLSALGIGAVIGAGIFVATGEAARNTAGPALMVSYAVAGITCIFAALCYAEFASMAPVAGSAYTYAYTTLGELFAWIIGWDLVLEYAVGAATVANGWSSYFQSIMKSVGIELPETLRGAAYKFVEDANSVMGGHFEATSSVINLPAVIVVAIVTAVLVKGIQESAGFNALMVVIKIFAVLFVIVVGAYYVDPANWEVFAPYGWTGVSFFGTPVHGQATEAGKPLGMLAGAAIIFFAYIGFDSVSTHAEEAIKPQRDVPIGIMASLLICTVLYIAVVAVLTGMVPYTEIDPNAGVSEAFRQRRFAMGRSHYLDSGRGRNYIGAVGDDAQRAARVSGNGARRAVAKGILCRCSSSIPHAVEEHDPRRVYSSLRWPACCRSTLCCT